MPKSPVWTAVDFYKLAAQLNRKGKPFAVATVLETGNSTPVKGGTKAIIDAQGKIHGSVGGGAAEAEAIRRAKEVLRSGVPVVFEFDLRGPGPGVPSPICGGSMRLLVCPGSSAPTRDYARAAMALARRKPGAWVTKVGLRDTLKVKSRFILEKRNGAGRVARAVQTVFQNQGGPGPAEQPSPDGKNDLFIEPLRPNPVLLIVGGGHISQALAAQATLVGFDLVVFEDRPAFASRSLFPPGTDTQCGPAGELFSKMPVDQATYIVLVSRGHPQDTEALRACIRTPAAYIGMIGSRRKVMLVRREFLKRGWATADDFNRIYAPVGLDLGAVTVPEIAASIVAQLIAVRRKGAASRMPLS